MLILNRISHEEVTIIDLPLDKTNNALLRGEVDAIASWGPGMDNFEKEIPQGVTFYGKGLYKWTWNLVGMAEFIQKNPGSITRTLRSLLKAETYIREHSDDSRRIVTDRFHLENGAKLRQQWDGYCFNLSLDPNFLLSLEDQARWAIRNNLIDRKTVPNFLEAIYFDGLKAVKPQAVTIVYKKE
jgi:NitT/TauT family transport system substrate-binding protein